jgi:peptide-methionine (S)-S-oxide reductase
METGKIWDKPIVTELKQFKVFYPAEEYHQEYFKHHPNQGYCTMVIAPKVAKFRKHYLEMLKK